jgi:membrane associated rhomboid family serine protease
MGREARRDVSGMRMIELSMSADDLVALKTTNHLRTHVRLVAAFGLAPGIAAAIVICVHALCAYDGNQLRYSFPRILIVNLVVATYYAYAIAAFVGIPVYWVMSVHDKLTRRNVLVASALIAGLPMAVVMAVTSASSSDFAEAMLFAAFSAFGGLIAGLVFWAILQDAKRDR